MPRILMVASEAVPFAKSGGLADVVGSLPAALTAQGEEVAVVIPRYKGVSLARADQAYEGLTVWLGPDAHSVDLYVMTDRGVPFFLVDCPPLYERDGLYSNNGVDHPDNHIRFAVLSRVALEVVRRIYRPEVLHCHDWQASLVAPYLKQTFASDPTFFGLKLLLTIHNLGYQGHFGPEILPLVGLDSGLYRTDVMEHHGGVNLLKGGIRFADAINTVSPRYSQEIQTPEQGFGLDHLLRERSAVVSGILNGVDYSDWDPVADPHITVNYSAEDLAGKNDCKRDLIEQYGFPTDEPDRPLIGIVSRLAAQKGLDLIVDILDRLMEANVSMVVLGTGEPKFEDALRAAAARHPTRLGVRIGFDNVLAHKIEAGSDMFLMPSHYEPCGLNQIYSLRYGTIPIVRATGGLDDTIDSTTGFKFEEYASEPLLNTVLEALKAFEDKVQWKAMMLRAMGRDYSWAASAKEYSSLYSRLLAN